MKAATEREGVLAALGALVFLILFGNLFCEPCAQPGVINRDKPCPDPISRASGQNCTTIFGFEALDVSTAVAASLFVGVMLFFAIKAVNAERGAIREGGGSGMGNPS